MSTAIVIFAFNRPDHLQQTLAHLSLNPEVGDLPVYFFIDGPRNEKDVKAIQQVKDLAQSFNAAKLNILARDKNLGLKRSVIAGISSVFESHEQAIILEDDICVSEKFVAYHLACLEKYKADNSIWSVSGYVIPELGANIEKVCTQPVVLAQRASSWGWSTWKSRWVQAEWNSDKVFSHFKDNYKSYGKTSGDKLRMIVRELGGKSSSWAIIWDYNHFLNNAYCIYPTHSYVRNIGLDNSGTHSKPKKSYVVDTLNNYLPVLPDVLIPDSKVKALFSKINWKPYRWPLDTWRLLKLLLSKR